MQKLSVIILSYTIDEEVYQINCRAIESLFSSEAWRLENGDWTLEVLLIESNRDSNRRYDSRVRVMMPEEKFGFHRFFNIGLDNTSGEFVAFCNNDIVFEKGWWSAIMKVKTQHPKFMCFSPADGTYPMMAEEMAKGKEYVIGWENKRHFAAWCFVWERKVFKTIGRFDEMFDFYSADDDELQTLHYWAISNVLVTGSKVKGYYVATGRPEIDGANLMMNAFSNNNGQPVLHLNQLQNQTEKDIQDGYRYMFAGAMLGIRNPKAHANEVISKEDALRKLAFASMLMYKLDNVF